MRRLPLLTTAATCAALTVPAAAQAVHKTFKTPTGKIQCAYYDVEGAFQIRCDLLFLNDRAVVLKTSGKARKEHVYDAVGDPKGKTLAYGSVTRYGAFECTSRRTGLTCKSRKTGHGFTVSKESQQVF
ncbi:MAG: hypothetical protein JWO02_3319 [Solirubrobacterales bacterium]|nr:hypothetical protein [Solirubrobacterales bacterium]